VIDVDTHILAQTPSIVPATVAPMVPIINDTHVGNSIDNMEPEAAIEAPDKYLTPTVALFVMNRLENRYLMRFTDVVSQENQTSKADPLIDTATSLNFVSKNFFNTNRFYKYSKAKNSCQSG
jgi:hypothetical protein